MELQDLKVDEVPDAHVDLQQQELLMWMSFADLLKHHILE